MADWFGEEQVNDSPKQPSKLKEAVKIEVHSQFQVLIVTLFFFIEGNMERC
jgi:hypothetical protein